MVPFIKEKKHSPNIFLYDLIANHVLLNRVHSKLNYIQILKAYKLSRKKQHYFEILIRLKMY